ncbi:MAG: mechanosensitive ion channel domain-containing protein [bacterium]
MELINSWFERLTPYWSTGVGIVGVIVVLFLVRVILDRIYRGRANYPFRRQVTTLALALLGVVTVILLIPSETISGQLLSLLGLLLSAAIALSSTTFIGNAFAGMMLRAVRNFRPGDFIRVGDYFGRVSERGLFHVEIQTEDRDLITMPNLYLVTNPVRVIRSSGTILTAEVSLGYDLPRLEVERALLAAAEAAELQEPYVQILELGDFSVTYRLAGLLTDTSQLISARSRLRAMMLDSLHRAKIEIVSPTFMNTRAIPTERQFIPRPAAQPESRTAGRVPEKIAFDKAEEAATIEKLRETQEQLGKDIEERKRAKAEAASDTEKARLTSEIERLSQRREWIAELISRKEKEE